MKTCKSDVHSVILFFSFPRFFIDVVAIFDKIFVLLILYFFAREDLFVKCSLLTVGENKYVRPKTGTIMGLSTKLELWY